MDMYPKYKSALGYQVGDNGIDSYGVNHNNFSLRDELEYQMARTNRESQLINRYNQQGINNNYPQQGVGFWGNSAENNYGFGSSNIGGNIENITNQLNAGGFNNQQTFGTNSYGNAANSATTQPNSYVNNAGMANQFVQNNNYNSGNNSSILQKFQELYRDKYGIQNPPFSQLKRNTIAPTATETPKRNVYQSLSGFAKDNQRWYENNPQKDSFNYIQDDYETNPLINDCLKSERYKQFITNIKQPNREGYGYSEPDQPTNSGISQKWYNDFKIQNPVIANNYPADVKYLTQEQVDNLYCQGFYKPLHNEIINDDFTSEHLFDIGVNIGETDGIPIIQNAINDITHQGISNTGGIGTETVSAINNVPNDDLVRFNNRIIDRRNAYHRSKNNRRFEKGWLNRSEQFRR